MTKYDSNLDLSTSHDEDTFSQQPDADGLYELPFLPLRDMVLYPRMVSPLFIGRRPSLAALQEAINNHKRIVVAAQKDENVSEPRLNDIYTVGTEASIGKAVRMPDETTSALAQGQQRVQIVEFTQWKPYMKVKVRRLQEPMEWHHNTEVLMRAVLTLFEKVVELTRSLPEDAYNYAATIDDPSWLSDFITSTLNIDLPTCQELLEDLNPTTRLQQVSVLLAKELEVLELEDQIHSQVHQEVERSHREHFLREQMRVIQGELGEMDVFTQDLKEVREALDKKTLPEMVKSKAEKELARLTAMPPMSPEVGIIRTYLDWVLDLPWLEESEDNMEVRHAANVLDDDHYGLDRVKERILEYIAVKQIAPNTMRSPILCFVGPPGTGKTSMGRSIAKAIGREFVRISLGGVRDEAEIRGHRRTYIGAMPGRIIQAMRRAGTINPMFMLDEIDKLGQDFRGDPSSALLEVLDPEQNDTFADHYLDVDYDLSRVMFITTANYLDGIPPALQDRMEIIEFSSYLEEEKREIGRQFLVPKQVEQHGLVDAKLQFADDAIRTIVREYTREAGVRNFEREVANVCRKIARKVAENEPFPMQITSDVVKDLLGPPRYAHDVLLEQDEIGVATGVAWTAVGGDILFIEVNLMSGKGDLKLTGKLGDVMKESAHAALSYVRSQSQRLGIDASRFESTDIHLHVPEGAIPKDGPSAGVTMVTALVSAFTDYPIHRHIGMTGEITLRGRVLPVGGIREKALAAQRAGITTFILPKKNESDLEQIPERLREETNFVLVERMHEVLQYALKRTPPKRSVKRTTPRPPTVPSSVT